jgi:putative transposase
VGIQAACRALALSRATFYRKKRPKPKLLPPSTTPARKRRRDPRALSSDERQAVLDLLHEETFMDLAVPQIYYQLLDQGRYLCSIRTMYRILEAEGELKERRAVRRLPTYLRPELLACGPNEVWSWDITFLKGPHPGERYRLYVILDIYSRFVVGWTLSSSECSALAAHLIEESCRKQGISAAQLQLHSDRGPSMTSKTVAEMLSHLGVERSLNRPYCSNDNPYSEAQFRTLKYCPTFPERFGSLEDARSFCRGFFRWYNHEHYHSGIAWLPPAVVHSGGGEAAITRRAEALRLACQAHPERFHRLPTPGCLPETVWINRPHGEEAGTSKTRSVTPPEAAQVSASVENELVR